MPPLLDDATGQKYPSAHEHAAHDVLPGAEYCPAGQAFATRDKESFEHQYPAMHWLVLCPLCASVTLKDA